jgi:hypothetical protein
VEETLSLQVATYPVEDVYKHLAKHHGIAIHVASNRLHRLKKEHGLPANFNLLFHKTGNVYRADDRTFVGSLTLGGKTEGEG